MTRVALKTPAHSYPAQGNRELITSYNFANAAIITDDLSAEQQLGSIDLIQSVFIDNGDNQNVLMVNFLGGNRLIVQPGKQGIFPVIVAGAVKYTLTSTQANINVTLIFSNTLKQFATW